MLERSRLFRPSIGVLVTAGGRAADSVRDAHPRHTYRNGYGQTPIPRGDEPPDAARPAQLAGLRTRRRAPGGAPSGRRFPVGGRTQRPVLLTAVVPAYRCGTVPDSHRVPS